MTSSSPVVASTALAHRRILLGVSGGIAAYKSPDLVRRLRERGAAVRVVLTRGAQAFITPLTLQAVSGHRVHHDLLDPEAEAAMGHIELARWADEVVIAPATADLIARLAHGRADDLLTTLALATDARIWLVPSMNRVMWSNPAVQDNLQALERRRVRVLGPGSGSQACGEEGEGRMLEPVAIADALAEARGPLAGRHCIVSAGPTYEDIDPVRFLGNRSSGRMGFAMAEALAGAGAAVTLVAGPVALATPAGVRRVDVRSAEEMRRTVFEALPADAYIAVAAVADYRPARPSGTKIRKGTESMVIELEPNPDILAEISRREPRPFLVGFAAETGELERYAHAKIQEKKLDLIAANRVGDGLGFEAGENALEVFSSSKRWSLERQPKPELARRLVAIIAAEMAARETRAA